VSTKAEEENIVKSLSGKRTHFTTDGIPEVGVHYLPVDIVELDLDAEEQGSEATEAVESEVLEPDLMGDTEFSMAPPLTGSDPTKCQKIWVGEVYVRVGVPLIFYDWEESLRNRGKSACSKTAERRKKHSATKTGMKAGALEPFLRTMKPGMSTIRAEKPDRVDRPSPLAFIDSAPKTRNRSPEELDIRKTSQKLKSDKKKENGTKSTSLAAGVAHSRSWRANPGVSPSEDRSILAKRPPNAPDVPLLRKSSSLTLDKYSPSEGDGGPRLEEYSNREEPKRANGSMNLASPKGPCEAVRRHRSPSPRESSSMGSGALRIYNPPNLKHTENGPSGSTTDSPTRSKEGAPISHRSGFTAEDSIDISELPLLCPRGGRQASYSVTSHFKRDSPISALTQTEASRIPSSPSPTQIFPAEGQLASLPSPPPPIPTTQPRHPPQRTKAKPSPPLTSPPPPTPRLSQIQSQGEPSSSSSSIQVSSLGAAAKVVRMVAPRESLAGAWKEVDELEARTRSNVFVGVEVLDMPDGS
jgi:holliday junction resolvase YEN1